MSHNQIKVAGQSPNSSSEITLNVNDVSAVSSPSDGQILSYNGSNWINKTLNFVSAYERALNSTNNFTTVQNQSGTILVNSNQPAGQQRFHYWFRNVGSTFFTNFQSNSNSDASLIYYTSGSSLFYKVRFNNAGVYRLYMKFAMNSIFGSADQAVEVQWSNGDNSVRYGPRVRLQRVERKQVPVIGVINASANDEIGLYKHALYNTVNDEMGRFLNYLLIIEKVG